MLRFLVTIFLSAWLLFQVQPCWANTFCRGSAAARRCGPPACCSSRPLLLGGYAYAHWSSAWLAPRRQAVLHLVLLAASLLLLPIGPDPAVWKPSPPITPTAPYSFLLLANIGLPYLLLASTAPLVQRWFHAAHPTQTPYPLYALSNAGSLLALLTYPLVVEPSWRWAASWRCGRGRTWGSWRLCAWCAVRFGWSKDAPCRALAAQAPPPMPRNGLSSVTRARADPSRGTLLFWLALSTCGSVLLLATTNQMSQEIPVIPFLWVLPLAIYLMTFMFVFHSDRWYDRRWYAIAVGVMVPVACGVMVVGLRRRAVGAPGGRFAGACSCAAWRATASWR